MGYKTGIDKRGRPYYMIDGRRVNAFGGLGKTASRKLTRVEREQRKKKLKLKLRKFFTNWFGHSFRGRDVAALIKKMFATRFRSWFIASKSSAADRYARLYAMRYILNKLRDSTNLSKFQTDEGKPDSSAFIEHLREKHDIDISEEPPKDKEKAVDVEKELKESRSEENLRIIRIVRQYNLTPSELEAVLRNYTRRKMKRT